MMRRIKGGLRYTITTGLNEISWRLTDYLDLIGGRRKKKKKKKKKDESRRGELMFLFERGAVRDIGS